MLGLSVIYGQSSTVQCCLTPLLRKCHLQYLTRSTLSLPFSSHVPFRSSLSQQRKLDHRSCAPHHERPWWIGGGRSGSDLNGLDRSVTRTFSCSTIVLRSIRPDRSAIGRFSSSSPTGGSKESQDVAVRPVGGKLSPAADSEEKVIFDPRSSEADKYYANLVKNTPTVADVEKAEAASATAGLSIWQRFKDLYKQYWYVVIPVHAALCVGWYGFFYFLALRGFDVLPLLEKIGISERLLNPLRSSGAGYLASAFAMYKIAAPLRYSVTLGVTTVAIRHLKKLGYIKPIPSTAQMRQFVNETRLQILSKRKNRKSTAKKDTIRRRLAVLFRRPPSTFGKASATNGVGGKGKSTE